MEIYPLLYFKTIAQTGNLTRAAEQLLISPPALSNALKRLEQNLGVDLFDRVGRTLVLNRYGQAYLPFAEKILSLTQEGNELMLHMQQEQGCHLAIADMTHVFAAHIISEFLTRHPEISLRRVYVDPAQQKNIDLVQAYDFAIGSTNSMNRSKLYSLQLRSGRSIVALVNRSNPLSSQETVTMEDLAHLPMIAYADGHPGRTMLNHLFKPMGTAPRVVYEGNTPHDMIPALERNLGIFLQPSHTAHFNMPLYNTCNCAVIPVTGAVYHANTSLHWSPSRPQSEAAKLFYQFCKEFCTTELFAKDVKPVFRKALLSDLDAVCAIYDAIHNAEDAGRTTTGWVRTIYPTRATAQQAIQSGDLFVLEQEGGIVASARINQIQGEEYKLANWSYNADNSKVMVLHTLSVHPDCSTHGFGTRFVSFYEDYAAQHGCTCLRLDTNVRNTAARALYKKLGYSEVSIVPCTFNGIDGVQLVCLEKLL